MFQRVIFWGAVLIGGYLALANSAAFVAGLNSAGTNSVNLVQAFQGR